MSEKMEKTFHLDGLVEGKIYDDECENGLRDWIHSVKSLTLPFCLEIDGRNFSVLAEPNVLPAHAYLKNPTDLITHALNELLEKFPPEAKATLLSTIRSVEYRPGKEVQTLYAVGPDGEIETRERILDAQTKAMPEPLTRKEKIKIALMGLAVVAVVFGASAFFVDYRTLFADIAEKVIPFNPQSLALENSVYDEFFVVTEVTKGQSGRSIFITLKRTPTFPVDSEIANALISRDKNSVSTRLAVEALVRGYVRYEFFDKNRNFLGHGELRIVALRSVDLLKIELPLPKSHNPVMMKLTY